MKSHPGLLSRSRNISQCGREMDFTRERKTFVASTSKANSPLRDSFGVQAFNSAKCSTASGRSFTGTDSPEAIKLSLFSSRETDVQSSDTRENSLLARATDRVDFPAPDRPALNSPLPSRSRHAL